MIVPTHESMMASLGSIEEHPSFILKRIPSSSSPPRVRRTVFKSLNPLPSRTTTSQPACLVGSRSCGIPLSVGYRSSTDTISAFVGKRLVQYKCP